MTTHRPEPDSAWGRHCPDAYPREWLTGERNLPEGFTRPATQIESRLIREEIGEAAYLAACGPPGAAVAPRKKLKKPNAVVRKISGFNRFLDRLPNGASPLAALVWCWLWRRESGGLARTSERKLAERFGVGRTAIRSRLRELEGAGYLSVVERGSWNRTPTVYKVRPDPRPGATGSKIAPLTGSGIDP